MDTQTTGAEKVNWDLTHLYLSESDVQNDLNEITREAEGFNKSWRGKIADLDAVQLRSALSKYELIQERIGRAMTYAYLSWVTATDDPERGALLQHVRELYTQISKSLLFFGLEWMRVEEDQARMLMEDDELAGYRHFLECERLLTEYTLSEPEERILSETQVTGRSAWIRFFTETISRMRFTFQGESLPQEILLTKLHAHDRGIRKEAADSFSEGLISNEHTLTYIFNTLLADKAANDRMRGLPHWLKSRNLGLPCYQYLYLTIKLLLRILVLFFTLLCKKCKYSKPF